MCLRGFIGVLLLNSRGAPPFKFVLPVQVAPKTEISFSVLIKHLFSLRCLIKAGNYLYLSATCCLGHNRPTSVWTLALYLARPGGFEPPTPWFVGVFFTLLQGIHLFFATYRILRLARLARFEFTTLWFISEYALLAEQVDA